MSGVVTQQDYQTETQAIAAIMAYLGTLHSQLVTALANGNQSQITSIIASMQSDVAALQAAVPAPKEPPAETPAEPVAPTE